MGRGCAWWTSAAVLLALASAGPRYSSRIVHTHAGAIRGIIVEPPSRRLEPVEAFLGVPYAGAPPRLGPAPPLPPWQGTRLADSFAPVCPQRPPDVADRERALAAMPLGVLEALRAEAPLLRAQSEDCLRLNLYVPGSGARGEEAPYAVALLLAGDLAWGSGNALDGAVLAARAHLLVVTLNHRLGLLGFLTSGAPEDAASLAGGAALLDVAAAVAWLRRAAGAFGGDPRRLTVVAHGGAAALATALLLAPASPLPPDANAAERGGRKWNASERGAVSGLLLASGEGLGAGGGPWPDAALTRAAVAKQLGCDPQPRDPHWLTACVRSRPLEALVRVQPPRARFLQGWAPSASVTAPASASATPSSKPADAFLHCALAVVLATTESYHFFSEEDIRDGFEEEQRNRVLRTFVRNAFRFHRTEILAAVRNEYTQWEKPIQHPANIRDATLDALSDGWAAAPALRLARAHAARGAPTYVAHLAHRAQGPVARRLGSVSGDTRAFLLGLPLLRNASRADAAAADAALQLLGSFAKGAPAAWPNYTLAAQRYVAIGAKLRVRSHYRGHKMALWLHLIPQLHRPGAPRAHHRLAAAPFAASDPDAAALDDELFAEGYAPDEFSLDSDPDSDPAGGRERVLGEGEECAPLSDAPPSPSDSPSPPPPDDLALQSHYYSFRVALGAGAGAGCGLLALNALALAVVWRRRRGRGRGEQRGQSRGQSRGPGRSRGLMTEWEPDSRQGSDRSRSDLERAPSPKKSSLKRRSEVDGPAPERALSACGADPAHKKRVQIQEISV